MISNKVELEKIKTSFSWQWPYYKRTALSVANTASSKVGFTLIELLVVISIIALLASIAMVALNSARQKSRDTKRIADITQISKAMELFFNSYNSYPTSASGVTSVQLGPISGSAAACVINTSFGCVNNLIPNVLVKIPAAPLPPDNSSVYACSNSYGSGAGTANDYQIAGSGGSLTSAGYTITFCLGSQVHSYSPGMHTLTASGISP